MTITKAIIPVAGLGTRLRPISYVVPKAMMPLADRKGRMLPVLHYILEEAAAAGAAHAAVIVSPPHIDMLRRYMAAVIEMNMPHLPQVEFLVQEEPLGFGHAVMMGRDFVGRQPFMLMLGDHVHVPAAGSEPCSRQVANAFAQRGGVAMIGMQPVDADELPRVGVARGEPLDGRVFRCAEFVEKPDLATARSRLVTPGLAADHFLAHAGIYIFDAEIFDLISELATRPRAKGKEVQLADAQSMLLQRHPDEYYLYHIAGTAHDTGTPAGFAATQKAMA